MVASITERKKIVSFSRFIFTCNMKLIFSLLFSLIAGLIALSPIVAAVDDATGAGEMAMYVGCYWKNTPLFVFN